MASPKKKDAPHYRGAAIIVAGLIVLAFLLAWSWWPVKPSLGNDRDVVATTDALFTALTSHNHDRLNECERRLLALRESGQLPSGAAAYLEKIVGQARAGSWDSAARKLYALIRSQSHQARVNRVTT